MTTEHTTADPFADIDPETGMPWPFPVGGQEQLKLEKPPETKLPETGGEAITPSQAKAALEFPKERPKLKDPAKFDDILITILGWPRCHDSASEKKFGDWLVTRLNKLKAKPTLRAGGCITVEVGKDSKVLFSCHIDTCHNMDEDDAYKLVYDPNFEHLYLDDSPEEKAKKAGKLPPASTAPAGSSPGWDWRVRTRGKTATCLGADDGAGVWLMLKMIEAKIPGAYIFHRGEEKGGIGSRAMLASPEGKTWLSKFKQAVAFDRAGPGDVIDTQGGQRCCSDEYAKALSAALTKPEMAILYKPCSGGTFTDTKVYIGIIPECTNISVGYKNQHGSEEYLDYGHLFALLDIVKTVKWEDLPIKRVCTTEWSMGGGTRGGHGGYYGYQGNSGSSHNGFQGTSNGSPGYEKSGGKGGKGVNDDKVLDELNRQRKKRAMSKLSQGFNDSLYGSLIEELYEETENADDLSIWLAQDDQVSAQIIMQLIIDARALEIKYEMLLAKTLRAG